MASVMSNVLNLFRARPKKRCAWGGGGGEQTSLQNYCINIIKNDGEGGERFFSSRQNNRSSFLGVKTEQKLRSCCTVFFPDCVCVVCFLPIHSGHQVRWA